jgi:hypothetical protein
MAVDAGVLSPEKAATWAGMPVFYSSVCRMNWVHLLATPHYALEPTVAFNPEVGVTTSHDNGEW